MIMSKQGSNQFSRRIKVDVVVLPLTLTRCYRLMLTGELNEASWSKWDLLLAAGELLRKPVTVHVNN